MGSPFLLRLSVKYAIIVSDYSHIYKGDRMSLYRTPQIFQDRLQEEFGDRLRVRWSDQWKEWNVEQKVRRGFAGQGVTEDRFSDDVIRYKDGYVWVMSFKQGTKFDCPKCGLDLVAPTRETVMVSCRYCKAKGYEHRWLASHWPMDECLIDHLKMLEKGIDSVPDKLRHAQAVLQKQQLRQVLDPTLAGFEDRFNKLAGIPSVGYTGKVFAQEA